MSSAPSAAVLSVDLGNTRCKLRWWDRPALRARALASLALSSRPQDRDATLDEIERWLARGAPADGHGSQRPWACLSAVGDQDLERSLRQRLERAFGSDRVRRPEPGLALEVRSAHTVGDDRLFAARAAVDLTGGSALVVSAGTALTVDAVRLEGEPFRRVFLGGAIAAGPRLVAEALARGTARLPLIELTMPRGALGRDTREAVHAGVVLGFRGAARELVAGVAAEAGLEGAPLVFSGGARELLLEPPLFSNARWLVEEDLVHMGLLAALGDELSRAFAPGVTDPGTA